MNPSARHENGIEGLRGFAALLVLYTHFLSSHDLDPNYSMHSYWRIFEASQGAVLMFFILSGYVIGLTNQREFSVANWKNYLSRRVLRIVPLCWLSLGLAMIVRPVGWDILLTNALFLQNTIPYGHWMMPVMTSNTNVWTLNYEAIYYLLFIVCWLRPSAWLIWTGVAVILSIAGWLLPGNWGPLAASYALGWVFWLIGYGLSRIPAPRSPFRTLPWPSILCFWFAVWQLKPLWNICHRFELLPRESNAWANYAFIDFMPSCVVLMLAASGRRVRMTRALCWIAALIPSLYCLWMVARGRTSLTTPDHCTIFCMIGWAFWWWRPDGVRRWARLASIGSVSYGLYILQRPVQWAVLDAAWLPSGSGVSFTLRFALAVALTFAIAWWGECRLQPWLRRRFTTAKASDSATVHLA